MFSLLAGALVSQDAFISPFQKNGRLVPQRVFLSHLCVKCTKILKGNSLVSETVEKIYDANNLLYSSFNTELHLCIPSKFESQWHLFLVLVLLVDFLVVFFFQ